MSTGSTPLFVAYDGSPDANLALTWAAGLASRRGDHLTILIARGDLYELSAWADEWTQGLAEEWGAKAAKVLAGLAGPTATTEILDGVPAEAIIRRSAGASLLVLGSRGLGRLAGFVLGSTSQQVVRHASCPVVVVSRTNDHADTVVVGVDGSDDSLHALTAGVDLARTSGHSVRAVSCWEQRPLVGDTHHDELMQILSQELQAREDRIREAVNAEGSRTGVSIDLVVSRDRPGEALVAASKTAALLVVGSRGRGAFSAMLLGSTSALVLARAACPVMVVR